MVDITRRTALFSMSSLPFLSTLLAPAQAADGARATRRLRFSAPASAWIEALPVGNGRVGAMVFGHVLQERIQLNHVELWSGRPALDDRSQSLTALPEVRRLLFDGAYADANKLAQSQMMTPMNDETYGSYQMLGDLFLDLEHDGEPLDYSRELNMAEGTACVRYRIGNDLYTRTIIASSPDQLLAIRLETTAATGMSLMVRLTRDQDADVRTKDGHIHLSGRPKPYGTAFSARLDCTAPGGQVLPSANGFEIKGAKEVILTLCAATDLLKPDADGQTAAVRAKASRLAWPTILKRQKQDHQSLFNTVTLELGALPVDADADARLQNVQRGLPDPAMAEAYFNFGRYLLIASSRPGSLPANLQGIWADGFSLPWSSDYHININLQMNYWPSEVCGLGALQSPLFDYTDRLLPHAQTTAQIAYGCKGAAAHYTTNPWGHTALDGQLEWGLWPEGLAWLSLHFWEHYQYSHDASFLRNRAYPLLRNCALFTLDYLVAHPVTGELVAGPATSPENTYVLDNGDRGNITMGPAMSQSIAYSVLDHTLRAAKILNVDADLQTQCASAIARLRRLHIGADGRIMEWPESFKEAEPGHRHISHLFGLYPGAEIDLEDTPQLADAARKTLSARLMNGGGQTGWSAAWLTMFRARLGEGDIAEAMLTKLFRESTSKNYFDTHPLGDGQIFQIDGNLGATAAIAEMLMQSHNGKLRILPALPKVWSKGRVTGLRARGGIEVDIAWAPGVATGVQLRAVENVRIEIRPPAHQPDVQMDGQPLSSSQRDLSLRKGRSYQLMFS